MKSLSFIALLALAVGFVATAQAQQDAEDCVYAVDLEDDDTGDYVLCGQDSGINKILKDLSGGENSGSTNSPEFKAKAAKAQASAKPQAAAKAKTQVLSPEPAVEPNTQWLRSPEALSARRFELLQLIAQECPNGFKVKSEKYAVGPNQGLDLQFDYRCN
ncbi:MAG: hypothetical protein OIF35_11780 [Cellvibrionaceae bacterium]|nr:hypothetical protein [Cellvibrionaceae bacterium]MCV6625607.1 hypothetical protein [Cellvibrionaceae bacterium]